MTAVRTFLTAAEVAKRLGLSSADVFHRRRDGLEAAGFPAPMPYSVFRRARIWRADEVDAWLDARGTMRPAPLALPPGVVDLGTERLLRQAGVA